MADKKKKEKQTEVEETVEQKPDKRDEEIERLTKELNESSDKFLRLAADFDNFKKRTAAEKLSLRASVVSDTVQMMLPILDNIERALQASKEESPLKDGVKMTLDQANAAFEKYGITSFGERGEAFDPEIHNAVMTCDDEEAGSGNIAVVLQRGYKIGDKIIRHALVSVAN